MKRWFLFFIIPIVLFNTGCQKANGKKRSTLRCIYDQAVFTEACRQALSDEKKFASFKKDPFYALLYQGYSYEEGWDFLHAIESKYPALIAHFDRFRTSDLIGNPQIYDYGDYGAFSPTTLHDIQIAGRIQEIMGLVTCDRIEPLLKGACKEKCDALLKDPVSCESRSIIQIGAGYGGLCKILHDLSLWDSYAIVDLPEQLALARKVLEKEGVTGVQFYGLDELPNADVYDFVISDGQFSEFSRPLQKTFLDRIVVRARAGLLLGHMFPKHFGVDTFSPEEIKAYLEKKKHTAFEMHRTQGERADYWFLWNKE